MAALASTAVTAYPTNLSRDNYPQGKGTRGVVSRSLKLVLTGQGGATNTIGASALGFTTILYASSLWDATNSKIYPAVVDPVNNVILLSSGADPQAPVDVTSTATYITVTGTPKLAR